MYTDAHCHLAHPDWMDGTENHLTEALARARAQGITEWVAGGIEPKEWESQKELKNHFPLRLVFGLHPWWVAKASEEEVARGLKRLETEMAQVAGVGELGLDKHVSKETLPRQRRAFEAQLALARRHHKPIVVHCVKAHADCLALLREGRWTGLVHRFQGSSDEAKAYLDRGLSLSLGGPEALTRPAAHAEMWRTIPASRLVLETDAPWDKRFGVCLADQLKSLVEIARAVGNARGETAEALLAQSKLNLADLFR